jgi:hypothetical protein
MQALGEVVHVRLGCGVGAHPWDSLPAQERSDQHDAAAAFIHHLPREHVVKADNGNHVDADHFQLGRQRRVGQWPAGGEPGGKNDETDVEVACLLLESVDSTLAGSTGLTVDAKPFTDGRTTALARAA